MLFTNSNKLKWVERELPNEVVVMEVKLKKTEPMQAATLSVGGSHCLQVWPFAKQ